MNNNINYSNRMRSHNRQPVYTSDKRAKFTQRENKKWIRLVTVLGYIVSVSMPAVVLSVYYIYIWDPGYVKKFPALHDNKSEFPVQGGKLSMVSGPGGKDRITRSVSVNPNFDNRRYFSGESKKVRPNAQCDCHCDGVGATRQVGDNGNAAKTNFERAEKVKTIPDLGKILKRSAVAGASIT